MTTVGVLALLCAGVLLLSGTAETIVLLGFAGCAFIGSTVLERRRPRSAQPDPDGLDWAAGAVIFVVVVGASTLFDGRNDAWVIGTAVVAVGSVMVLRWLRARSSGHTTA